jgi:hypothetical protein
LVLSFQFIRAGDDKVSFQLQHLCDPIKEDNIFLKAVLYDKELILMLGKMFLSVWPWFGFYFFKGLMDPRHLSEVCQLVEVFESRCLLLIGFCVWQTVQKKFSY